LLSSSPWVQVLPWSRRRRGCEHRRTRYPPIQVPTQPVNWLLMVVTIVLTVGFGKSDDLAAAYGIAVSATKLMTSALLNAMREIWQWSLPQHRRCRDSPRNRCRVLRLQLRSAPAGAVYTIISTRPVHLRSAFSRAPTNSEHARCRGQLLRRLNGLRDRCRNDARRC
jgi:hypothetical protein